MKSKYNVVTVGSAAIDCFMSLPVDFKEIRHGSKILIKDIELLTGGGGTNVAVGLSRLGLKVGFIGELGMDNSASMIQTELKKEKVDFLVKEHSRHMTAYSVVLESKGKDRAILVYKGASSYLDRTECPKDISADWLYLASVVGSSFNTMSIIARLAQKKQIPIYFNPSSYMIEKDRKKTEDIIKISRIIALNKEEAQILTDIKTQNIRILAQTIHKLGPEICIITDGKKGAYAFDGWKLYYRKNKPLKVIDTTGAGDAFGAGFLAGFIEQSNELLEKRIDFAMDLAVKNAESVILHVGAKPGLLRKGQFRLRR